MYLRGFRGLAGCTPSAYFPVDVGIVGNQACAAQGGSVSWINGSNQCYIPARCSPDSIAAAPTISINNANVSSNTNSNTVSPTITTAVSTQVNPTFSQNQVAPQTTSINQPTTQQPVSNSVTGAQTPTHAADYYGAQPSNDISAMRAEQARIDAQNAKLALAAEQRAAAQRAAQQAAAQGATPAQQQQAGQQAAQQTASQQVLPPISVGAPELQLAPEVGGGQPVAVSSTYSGGGPAPVDSSTYSSGAMGGMSPLVWVALAGIGLLVLDNRQQRR